MWVEEKKKRKSELREREDSGFWGVREIEGDDKEGEFSKIIFEKELVIFENSFWKMLVIFEN